MQRLIHMKAAPLSMPYRVVTPGTSLTGAPHARIGAEGSEPITSPQNLVRFLLLFLIMLANCITAGYVIAAYENGKSNSDTFKENDKNIQALATRHWQELQALRQQSATDLSQIQALLSGNIPSLKLGKDHGAAISGIAQKALEKHMGISAPTATLDVKEAAACEPLLEDAKKNAAYKQNKVRYELDSDEAQCDDATTKLYQALDRIKEKVSTVSRWLEHEVLDENGNEIHTTATKVGFINSTAFLNTLMAECGAQNEGSSAMTTCYTRDNDACVTAIQEASTAGTMHLRLLKSALQDAKDNNDAVDTGTKSSNCLPVKKHYLESASGNSLVGKLAKSTVAMAKNTYDHTVGVGTCEVAHAVHFGTEDLGKYLDKALEAIDDVLNCATEKFREFQEHIELGFNPTPTDVTHAAAASNVHTSSCSSATTQYFAVEKACAAGAAAGSGFVDGDGDVITPPSSPTATAF